MLTVELRYTEYTEIILVLLGRFQLGAIKF